jgi:hypothetical protein
MPDDEMQQVAELRPLVTLNHRRGIEVLDLNEFRAATRRARVLRPS